MLSFYLRKPFYIFIDNVVLTEDCMTRLAGGNEGI